LVLVVVGWPVVVEVAGVVVEVADVLVEVAGVVVGPQHAFSVHPDLHFCSFRQNPSPVIHFLL
jgi:hypothetical protein